MSSTLQQMVAAGEDYGLCGAGASPMKLSIIAMVKGMLLNRGRMMPS
jgi:hypothetical protein